MERRLQAQEGLVLQGASGPEPALALNMRRLLQRVARERPCNW
jgi:hypothetical protein